MSQRTHSTLKIEALIKTGASVSSIAREAGVSHQRVYQIKKRALSELQLAQEVVQQEATAILERKQTKSCDLESINVPLSTLTIELSPRIQEALGIAVMRCNRAMDKDEDPITRNEYVEQVLMGHLAELGLLKRKR